MVSHRAGVNALLAVSVVLLICFMLFLGVVLLEDNPDMYSRFYQPTYLIQPIFTYAWSFSLALSVLLLSSIPPYFGREVLGLIQWKISLGIFFLAGIPSLAIGVVGFFMRGI
jgi:hypothetical protein